MAYTYIPDEYGRPPTVRFQTLKDFLDYVADLDAGKYPGLSVDRATREQADKIQSDPKQWTIENGHPKFLGGWLDRNLEWVIPAVAGAVGFGVAAPALFGGAGGAAAGGGSGSGAAGSATGGAAAGTLPATMGNMTNAAMYATPAAIASQGVSQGLSQGGWQTAAEMIRNTVPGARNWTDDLLSQAISALSGIPGAIAASRNSGPSDEEKALMQQAMEMQKLQQRRIEFQNPLYEAVSQMAMSRLPTAQQRTLPERL